MPLTATSHTNSQRRRQPELEYEGDESSTGEEPGAAEDTEEDSEDTIRRPRDHKPHLKRPPSTHSGGNRNIRNQSRSSRPSSNTETGTSIPSYEQNVDDAYQGDDNYPYLSPPPSQRQPPSRRRRNPQLSPPPPPPPPPPPTSERTAKPPHTSTPPDLESDSSISSSFSSSSAGPWKPLAAAAAPPKPSTSRRSRPVPPRRNRKTVRDPAGEPVQAVIPRSPRNNAVSKIEEEEEAYDDDQAEEDEVMPVLGPPQPAKSLVAGGKKAKLAVELKLNLEIEIQLKVHIQGDLTLELF
ncbi:hypothetical protein VM1G_01630 [Cytospora mali]|uniref:Uncharacterized protein n=1 Tax=Cytospora mali TaxID=578113 RepID=A0A194VQK6_CYTMA|nr:hypothetical protein VM1G_01630 [Valsa mali]